MEEECQTELITYDVKQGNVHISLNRNAPVDKVETKSEIQIGCVTSQRRKFVSVIYRRAMSRHIKFVSVKYTRNFTAHKFN